MSSAEHSSQGIITLVLLIALASLIVIVLAQQILEQYRQRLASPADIVETGEIGETEPLLPRWTRRRLQPSSRRASQRMSRRFSRRISRPFAPRVLEIPVEPASGHETDGSEEISPCTTPVPQSPLSERKDKMHYPSMRVAPFSSPPCETTPNKPVRHCMHSKNFKGLRIPEADGRKMSLEDEDYIDERSPEAENDDVFKRAFAGEGEFKMYVRGMDGRRYTNTPPF